MYEMTTERAVRAAFWAECGHLPGVTKRRIPNYSGYGTMHTTDTRVAFADWLDGCAKSGRISSQLAARVTL